MLRVVWINDSCKQAMINKSQCISLPGWDEDWAIFTASRLNGCHRWHEGEVSGGAGGVVLDLTVFFVVARWNSCLSSPSTPFVLVYYSRGDEAPLGMFSYRSPISVDNHLQDASTVQLWFWTNDRKGKKKVGMKSEKKKQVKIRRKNK